MIRGNFAWLHVNDGSVALGIWAPKTLVQDVACIGDYHTKGDSIEISGVFHRTCPEHGGDLDIHASEIKIVTRGSLVIRPYSRKKFFLGILVLIPIFLFYKPRIH